MEPLTKTAQRAAHPNLPQLVGGLALRPAELEKRADKERLSPLFQMLSNAEYWLSFDLASFEPLLAKSPSPLRELGVAVALRFSERPDGNLGVEAIVQAKEALIGDQIGDLAEDLREGLQEGLSTLERAVLARERTEEFKDQGFKAYSRAQGLSVHALRAAGKSAIEIAGASAKARPAYVPLGEPVLIKSLDERGRPLAPVEVESRIDAPVLVRDEEAPGQRQVIFLIPGEYHLRVPGRASGDRKVMAR